MPNLNCTVKNCYYNKTDRCTRDDILIEGKSATTTDSTTCDSFKMKNDSFTNSCNCSDSPKDCVKVACRAVNCSYNDKFMCSAKHVNICGASASKSDQTECDTFTM